MRAIKRAGLSIRYTEGFHPKPKIQFDDPLPLGIESEAEVFTMSLPKGSDVDAIAESINRYLPEGITILECRIQTAGKRISAERIERYRVVHPEVPIDPDQVRLFMAAESFKVTRKRGNGRTKKIDLRQSVKKVLSIDPLTLQLDLVRTAALTVRPGDILKHVIGFSDEQIRQSKMIKTDVMTASASD
jgi:radical SAM-linked protein